MSEDMNENGFDEKRVRQEVEKRFKEREGLIIHGVVFVLINAMLWMIGLTAGMDFPWPLIVTLGWTAGMFAHAYDYYNKYGGGAQRREDAIQREIERYRDQYAYEKPKNRSRMELTEDGEIEEVYNESISTGRRERR